MDQLCQPLLVKEQAALMAVNTTWPLFVYHAEARITKYHFGSHKNLLILLAP